MNKVEQSLWIEANYPLSGLGRPRDPLYGTCINDAAYVTNPTINGKMELDPAYVCWMRMLERANSIKFQDKCTTYIGVTVCNEWRSFISFRKWWLDHYREGCELDKDLLVVGNREYGYNSCIYVPGWLNRFTCDSRKKRGDFPIGVSLYKPRWKFMSKCHNPITGKRKTIGYFDTPAAAHAAWLQYKLSLADQLKPEMDAIDHRIHPNVVTIIKALR